MTKMEMCYDGTLVMPSNYAVINEEEMSYVDGGVAIPNGVVAFGINCVVQAIGAVILGGGGGIATAKAAIAAIGVKTFTDKLKSMLYKFIAIKLANAISGTIVGLILGSGGYGIGSMAIRWWDSRDSVRNNGWCNF